VGWRCGGGATEIGLCARTAASFWVFLTRSATDFFAGKVFRPVVLCVATFFVDFAATGFRPALFFEVALAGNFLAATFPLLATFADFFETALCATARVAWACFVGVDVRRLAADLGAAL